ncbi:MAG: AAA family ATPase, partial [bacterium]|nr:AAA family ATPase [bacterium]
MTYRDLHTVTGIYRGALRLSRVTSGPRLRRLEKLFRGSSISLGILLLLVPLFALPLFSELVPSVEYLAVIAPLILSLFLFSLGLWLVFLLLYAFFASYYFKDSDTTFPELGMESRLPLSYDVAEVISQNRGEPLFDFLLSHAGLQVTARLGLMPKDIAALLQSERTPLAPESLVLEAGEGETIGLPALCRALFRASAEFRQFLAEKEVEEKDVIRAAEWVSRAESEYKKWGRAWGRDALGRIPGIGKDWGYGEIVHLQKYAQEITSHPAFFAAGGIFGKREEQEVERILSRGREANVLLVAEEGVPALHILARLARSIRAGTAFPPLEHKRIFIFDGALFVSSMKEKTAFERELTHLLREAVEAGNIILVFTSLEKFLQSAAALSSDALMLLEPFLSSNRIQIVATAEVSAFHATLEGNPKIRERFEKVLISGAGAESSIPALEDEALRLEGSERVFFTVQSVVAVGIAAERYFFEGVMPDKAIDLLHELPAKVKGEKRHVILESDVEELVSRKTGIAAGKASGEERTKLLRLEEILHERIVGQEAAVSAISGALRRARSGVGNPNRPMGSFLFLGPTGVGKTETTKALAQVFFGDETLITRFDMSEFQTEDALHRLIGTFEGGVPG